MSLLASVETAPDRRNGRRIRTAVGRELRVLKAVATTATTCL